MTTQSEHESVAWETDVGGGKFAYYWRFVAEEIITRSASSCNRYSIE